VIAGVEVSRFELQFRSGDRTAQRWKRATKHIKGEFVATKHEMAAKNKKEPITPAGGKLRENAWGGYYGRGGGSGADQAGYEPTTKWENKGPSPKHARRTGGQPFEKFFCMFGSQKCFVLRKKKRSKDSSRRGALDPFAGRCAEVTRRQKLGGVDPHTGGLKRTSSVT